MQIKLLSLRYFFMVLFDVFFLFLGDFHAAVHGDAKRLEYDSTIIVNTIIAANILVAWVRKPSL